MLSCCRSTVRLNRFFLPYFFFKTDFKRNVITNCICHVNFSTSSSLLVMFDKGTKANLTQEQDISERLSRNIKAVIKDPKLLKQGFNNLIGEFGKFYQDYKDNIAIEMKYYDWQDRRGQIDIAFKFETDEELKRFVVNCDEKVGGYSTADFVITQNKTGLFHGNLNTELPKDGNVVYSGYANIMSLRPVKAFERPGYFNWKYYTHFVLKVRGDGRTYAILLATPGRYNVTWNDQYSYPLYTRGGPYWQITKIPFSHFIMSRKTRIDKSFPALPADMIARFGITLGDSYDGPFKLEIDYIGLERKLNENYESPYERYYFKQ